MEHLPTIGSSLELSLGDGRRYRLVVEGRRDDGLVVAGARGAAYPDLISLDVPFTIGWLADRSWFVVPATRVRLADATLPRWQVDIASEPRAVNRRRFMRGGGGEPIRITDINPAGGPDILITGTVVDLSEGGVRCQVPELRQGPGDTARMSISFDDRAVEMVGIVQDLREPRQGEGVDAVLVYGLPEGTAQLIRRYLFRRELEGRRAAREADLAA